MGYLIFGIGCYFIWDRLLKEDWAAFNGRCIGWKLGYAIISILSIIILFFINLIVAFLRIGFSCVIRPDWMAFASLYGMPAGAALMPLVIWFINKRRVYKK